MANDEGDQRDGDSPTSAAGRRRKDESGSAPEAGVARTRRWWEQPLVWVGVVVVVILAGLGISLAIDTNPDVIVPVGDTTAFCGSVNAYLIVSDGAPLTLSTSPESLAELQAAFVRVQDASPPEIRPSTEELRAGLDRMVAGLNGMRRPPGGEGTLPLSEDITASIELVTKEQQKLLQPDQRFQGYVLRACGLNLDERVPGTGTTASTPTTAFPGTSLVESGPSLESSTTDLPAPPTAPTTELPSVDK